MMLLLSAIVLLLLSPISPAALLFSRDGCTQGYDLCAPSGASNRDVPPIGPQLRRLFLELLDTVNPQPQADLLLPSSTGAVRKETPTAICCRCCGNRLFASGKFPTSALLGLPISFLTPCIQPDQKQDHFTTNFFLPDGSYGTISDGNYVTTAGDAVNLITGDYLMANGQSGNIYNDDPSDKPNTSTLPMPTPYTSKGVGSAIPASEVGGFATYTTVIPGTTILPSTVPPSVVYATPTGYGYGTLNETTIPGYTIPGTSISARTSIYTSAIITPPINNEAVNFGCPSWALKMSSIAMVVLVLL